MNSTLAVMNMWLVSCRFLSHSELAPLRVPLVPMEHCTSRFFQECDADKDKQVSFKEWTSCFGIKNGKSPSVSPVTPASVLIVALTCEFSSVSLNRADASQHTCLSSLIVAHLKHKTNTVDTFSSLSPQRTWMSTSYSELHVVPHLLHKHDEAAPAVHPGTEASMILCDIGSSDAHRNSFHLLLQRTGAGARCCCLVSG